MRKTNLTFGLFLSFSLLGCNIHPLPEDVVPYSTSDIAEKIRCEARAAIRAHIGTKMDGGGIGYNFAFTITENNNASIGSKFLIPFSTGKFGLDAGLGQDRQRQTERKFFITDTFGEMISKTAHRDLRKTKFRCPEDDSKNWRYPITGVIGLDEVVRTFVELGAPQKFSDVIMFTTKVSGSISPKLELNPVKDRFRITELSGSLKADRQDIHKVTIILAGTAVPGAPAGLADTDVRDRLLLESERLESLDNQGRILDELRRR